MSYKKFENADLFYNTIKAKPRFEFKIWGGKAVVNNGAGLALLNNLQTTEPTALVQPYIPSPVGCDNPNSFDFSCPDNSYNIGAI
jgi:hypothetical protein